MRALLIHEFNSCRRVLTISRSRLPLQWGQSFQVSWAPDVRPSKIQNKKTCFIQLTFGIGADSCLDQAVISKAAYVTERLDWWLCILF